MSLRSNANPASASMLAGPEATAIMPVADSNLTISKKQDGNCSIPINADDPTRGLNTSEQSSSSQGNTPPFPAETFAENDILEPVQKLSATAITVVMMPLCISCFLSALDLTVITPAIPAIASSFKSTTGYVWIGSAFVLSSTASTPLWGSAADIWGRKPVILVSLSIFLVGSLICALAPQLNVLIAGRSVQGLGSSGMGIMINVIICDTFSLRDRGLYLAITSIVWAIGSAVGPIIGGAFTTNLSWRWCFWINLPLGATAFVVLLLFLKVPSPKTPVLAGLKSIDWTGSLLIVGVAMMVLLGLDFGNVIFPWSSATVICLIVFGFATSGIFIINEWKFAANPVIPLRLFRNRSTVAAYIVWACNFYILIGLSYYLPLFSQSVLGANALISGVYLIPLIVSCSLAAACVGAFIQKTGVYLPIAYIAHILLLLGTGLLINLKPRESLAKLIVYEIITGMGVGMNIEPPVLAAQATMAEQDTAAIQSTMTFLRSLATTIAIVAGGVIFQNRMSEAGSSLTAQVGQEVAGNFSGKYAAANVGLIELLPLDQQWVVKDAYFGALRADWTMFVGIAGFSLLSTFLMRAHQLRKEQKVVVLGVNSRMAGDAREPISALQPAEPIELGEIQENRTG